MSDDLKNIYKAANKLAFYFDDKTPRDLYRGQTSTEERKGTPVLYPNPGFTRKHGPPRLPDVQVFIRQIEKAEGGIVEEKWVKGCRTMRGDYRGVSTFSKVTMPSMTWYRLPKDTDIPVALAVTQDGTNEERGIHYTIAPKDDMPLSLYQVWLNELNAKLSQAEV
ncbi:MAG TPA: hypothetical protein VN158_10645 [Caulobacter sp.]|nr:hypothetical protein [Caulobacter sp.]